MKNLSDAQIYVGTYYKHNSGDISGEWLQLSDYSDITEFYEACKALHSDESDPEYMFQDYENIPNDLISESWISSKFWEIAEALEEIEDPEAFQIFIDNFSFDMENDPIDDLIEKFNESFSGDFSNSSNPQIDFAYQLIDECYNIDEMMRGLLSYFDYESFTRDLFMSDYWETEGYIFRNI